MSTAGDLSPLDYRSATDSLIDPEPIYAGLRLSSWLKIGFIAVLFCGLFWPNLRRLWEKTNPFYGEANWGHAICVPLIGLYYLYVNREELLKIEPKPMLWGRFLRWQRFGVGLALVPVGFGLFQFASTIFGESIFTTGVQAIGTACIMFGILLLLVDWGLASLFTGLLVYTYGIYPGQNDFIKDFGMVITLFGTVLVLCGWDIMRIAWFPIAFLVCAIPWPGLVYSLIAGPLQVLAAHAAVGTLQLTGVTSFQGGTKIFIEGYGGDIRTLNVAEACAGLRSLMTFVSVGAAVAFLSARPMWQKLMLTFMSVPIAIACNVARVSGQGLLDHYVSQQLSESFAHQFVGMIMLVPAFFLILLVAWVLDKLFVDELDQRLALMTTGRLAVPTGPIAGAIPIPQTSLRAARATPALERSVGPSSSNERALKGAPGKVVPPPPAGSRPALRRAMSTGTPTPRDARDASAPREATPREATPRETTPREATASREPSAPRETPKPKAKPRPQNRIPEPPKSMRPPSTEPDPSQP